MSAKVVLTGWAGGRATPIYEEALKEAGVDAQVVAPEGDEEDILRECEDADVVVNGPIVFDREKLGRLKRCRAVIFSSVGYDRIDLSAATELGIMVANNPDFCIDEVANHALALLLAVNKKIVRLDRLVREGRWGEHREWILPIGPIHGETLGLLGYGNIARAMGRRGRALNMRVIAYDPFVSPDILTAEGVEPVPWDEVFRQSDYIS